MKSRVAALILAILLLTANFAFAPLAQAVEGESSGTDMPSPSPSLSPSPSPTPSPSPSPSPTPEPEVLFTAEDITVPLMAEFNLLTGVSAVDEAGGELEVSVKDDGGFAVDMVADYTITYAATHPKTEQEHTCTRTVSVKKTPEQERFQVIFTMSELFLCVGDATASLLAEASAADELGNKLEFGVLDDGGFNINIVGAYVVKYGARHPVLGELATATRRVNVLTKEEYEARLAAQNPLAGKSDSRYRKYLQYREEIFEALSAKMQELNGGLEQRLELLRGVLGASECMLVFPHPELLDDSVGGEASETDLAGHGLSGGFNPESGAFDVLESPEVRNWADILAVFVAMSSLDVEEPLDLYNLRKISFGAMDGVFWDMVELSYHIEGSKLWLVIEGRTAYEMMDAYGMSQAQRDSLEELMQPEFQGVFATLTGDDSFAELSEDEVSAIRESFPEGLDVQRQNVVETAYTLLDKVDYFWGGKFNELGWNSSWGMPKLVTSLGSRTTGNVRPYGLDCSGFVAWSFINAAGDTSIADAIGNGSANQWANSVSLGWDEAEVGDITFRRTPSSTEINHVGIIASKAEDGTYMVIHCSSSHGGVVVTEAWSSGFRYMRRPLLYSEETGAEAANE